MESVGSVGEGVGRVVVDLEEEAVDAGGGSGAGQRLNIFRLSAALASGGSGELEAVGDVEDGGVAEVAHHLEAAEIDHEVLVSEAGAALGEQDFLIAGGGDLLGCVLDVPGGQELALLDVDDAAGAAGFDEDVGLAGEEGGDLEDVADFGGGADVRGFMNVG